ncbi:MAG: TonB family protein [Chthoniobacterales bacterium]
MPGGVRFWRNFAIIAGAHVAVMAVFLRWGGSGKTSSAQQVVWLGGAEVASASSGSGSSGAASPASVAPTPEESVTPEPQDQPTVAPAESEIQLPTATPTPTAPPRPVVKLSPVPPAKPTQTPRITPKPPSKKAVAKATPKPQPKPTARPAPDDDDSAAEAARAALAKIAGGQSGASGTAGGGGSTRSETQWYGRMLHDRFHSAWEQPTTVVASGAKMSALVRVRIEKNGHVSRFDVVKPSGNVIVDESVRAVANSVTQVDPLPNGVGGADHYDVTINFELNPEE